MNEEENLRKAAKLAKWLLEEKKADLPGPYIIAARKYKIVNWHDVQRYYNQHLKDQQLRII